MVDEIRKKLDKVTGELLEAFIPFDKTRVLKFQAGLYALHGAQKDLEDDKKTNLYAVSDDAVLEKLLAEHGISQDDFDKVPSVIQSFEDGKIDAYETLKKLPELLQEAIEKVHEKSRGFYEVPASGMIAVTLNLINNDAKNALIAGQVGERTLQVIDRISGKDIKTRPNLRASTRLSNSYVDKVGNEPEYLTAARATSHLADLLEDVILLKPDIIEHASVKNSLQAFKYIVTRVFLKSADNLKNSGVEEAGDSFMELANHLSVSGLDGHNEAIDAISNGLDFVRQVFEENSGSGAEAAKYFEEVVNKRLAQLRDFEKV